jgi:hypothetical protein
MLGKRDIALAIAAKAHEGAVDKAYAPYIFHPMRVAEAASKNAAPGTWDNRYIVGVLHDVLEDSDIDEAEIAEALDISLDSDVMNALRAISREDGEPYVDYIERCGRNELARVVKMHDLEDNMNLDRIANPGKVDYHRVEKYGIALLYLRNLVGPGVPF